MILIVIYVLSLAIILVFSIQNLLLYLLSLKKERIVINSEVSDFDWPFVTVQIPLYNEGSVASGLLEACRQLDYPRDRLQIQVLDDSTDDTTLMVSNIVEDFRNKGIDIELIHRDCRQGFKAGALDNGLKTAKGEFVAIFDADFLPQPDFLKKIIPYFKKSDTGFIQTSWRHRNANESVIAYLQDLRLKSHFFVAQKPRSENGMLISFDGSSGVWRRRCIEEASGWMADTLAEDLDLSIRAQLKGWKGKFFSEYLSSAELPYSLNNFKTQQFRWTKGVTEVLSKCAVTLIKSNISLKRKADVLLRLTSNIVFPLILIVTVLNIPVYQLLKNTKEYSALVNIMPVFLLALLTAFLTFVFINKKAPGILLKRALVFPLFLSGVSGISISNTFAFFEGLAGIRSPFVRTPKSRGNITREIISLKRIIIAALELALSAYSIWGLYYFIAAGDYFSIFFQALVAFGYLVFAINSLFRR